MAVWVASHYWLLCLRRSPRIVLLYLRTLAKTWWRSPCKRQRYGNLIMIIIITIIALKGANRDFYNLLTAPRTVSNTYAQVARAQSFANRVQHIERLSRATCSVPLGTKGQLSDEVWQSRNRIYFSFVLLSETINRWTRKGNRSTLRKPLTTNFSKYHILKTDNPSPKRDSNPYPSVGGRLGKQTC